MTIVFAKPTIDIPRDRWSRPLITPADGGKPVPYTRMSTLAKALDDKSALTKWKQRQTIIGLAARPDLVQVAQTVKGDDRKLDEIAETAMVAAESERAANLGTALHSLSEQVDAGADIDTLPEWARADMAAYKAALTGIEILAARADAAAWIAPLNDAETAHRVRAERAFSRALGGSCQIPLGGYAVTENGELWLRGFVATPDGQRMVRGEIHGQISGIVHAVVEGDVNISLLSGTAEPETADAPQAQTEKEDDAHE